MKQPILFVASIFLLLLNTSCEKAAKIHLISAQTWVVTEISSGFSNFANVGDELTFHDNRLFFSYSNGAESDGRWEFEGSQTSPFAPATVEGLSITAGFGAYSFSILTLDNNELKIQDITNFGSPIYSMKAKE
ncbi:hypothetical protein [Aureispira sp. CCB-E]|uniref:hypothetical protein n=1 Tax=Aureispira sp. CCB-E TaxID=3051121 RepID=UPI0028693A6C|nr:hypothetical protein [Aureispira sp. CCB-E]WMX15828.1 hypothetical protein QP953_05445 [Aureispira sp. CCB-E]